MMCPEDSQTSPVGFDALISAILGGNPGKHTEYFRRRVAATKQRLQEMREQGADQMAIAFQVAALDHNSSLFRMHGGDPDDVDADWVYARVQGTGRYAGLWKIAPLEYAWKKDGEWVVDESNVDDL